MHVLLAHVHAAHIVQHAVVALPDHGHYSILDAGQRVSRHHPAHRRVVDGADALRVGEHDRRLDETPLTDRMHAHDLTYAVGGEGAGDDTLVPDVVAVRDDGGDAGAGGPAASRQVGPAPRHRAMPDHDPGHIGDSVQRTRRQDADGDAQLARAGAHRRHDVPCPLGIPSGSTERYSRAPARWALR